MRPNQVVILVVLLLFSLTFILDASAQTVSSRPALIDPMTIPKWTNQLDNQLPVYVPTNITDSKGNVIRQEYTVTVSQFMQQILPTVDSKGNPTGYGQSEVWGYGGEALAVTGERLGFVRSVP